MSLIPSAIAARSSAVATATTTFVLAVWCALHARLFAALASASPIAMLGEPHANADDEHPTDAGQSTAEYALVLIGAAALALLLITWATKTDRIGKLFDFVLDRIKGNVG